MNRLAMPQPAKGLFDSLTTYFMTKDDEDEEGKSEDIDQSQPHTFINAKEGKYFRVIVINIEPEEEELPEHQVAEDQTHESTQQEAQHQNEKLENLASEGEPDEILGEEEDKDR